MKLWICATMTLSLFCANGATAELIESRQQNVVAIYQSYVAPPPPPPVPISLFVARPLDAA